MNGVKNEIAVIQNQDWTDDQKKLIKDTVCRGATDDELKLFFYVSKKVGLDPLAKQIYAVKRWDKQLGRESQTIQTGIDGFRVIAERSGEYEGQTPIQWCGKDGAWKDVWLQKDPPMAAKVGVYRKGFKEPIVAVALYDDYVQLSKEGKPTKFWHTMPTIMIAKCAESNALRKAFPQDLSGIFSSEEMGQADNDQPIPQKTIEKTPEEKKEIVEKGKARAESIVVEMDKTYTLKQSLIKQIKEECARATQGFTQEEKVAFMKNTLRIKSFKEIDNMDTGSLDDVLVAVRKYYDSKNEISVATMGPL